MPRPRKLVPRAPVESVAQEGSTAPFEPWKRWIAIKGVLDGRSAAAVAKELAILWDILEGDPRISSRVPSERSVQRWFKDFVTGGARISARSPPGRPLRLSRADDDVLTKWANEVRFFTQDQFAEILYVVTNGKVLQTSAVSVTIDRLGLSRKKVSRIDPRLNQAEVLLFYAHLQNLSARPEMMVRCDPCPEPLGTFPNTWNPLPLP